MRSRIRVLLVIFSGLIVLGLLAWTSAFLYWHLRITRCVRIRENLRIGQRPQASAELDEASRFLILAGARSMPYLVAELGPLKHPEFLQCASYVITRQSLECVHEEDITWGRRMWQWVPVSNDAPAVQLRKYEIMREWWKKHGAEYHPWWRVWSGKCSS